jgi:hypothetical protein
LRDWAGLILGGVERDELTVIEGRPPAMIMKDSWCQSTTNPS